MEGGTFKQRALSAAGRCKGGWSMDGIGNVWGFSKGPPKGAGGLSFVALVLSKSVSAQQQPSWPYPLNRIGLYPKGCRYFNGKPVGISCFSHSPLKPNQSQSLRMERKERQVTKFGSRVAFSSYLFLSGEANYPFYLRNHCHTHSSPTSPNPSPPLELLPWLPGMVAKSLHGRVGVGCAATNITMVNQGTPGISLGRGGIIWI